MDACARWGGDGSLQFVAADGAGQGVVMVLSRNQVRILFAAEKAPAGGIGVADVPSVLWGVPGKGERRGAAVLTAAQRASASRAVRRLEGLGYVARRREDGGRPACVLTEEGRRLCEYLHTLADRHGYPDRLPQPPGIR